MMMQSQTQHRQSLVITEVRNPKGVTTNRYVDADVFELWRHWMCTRHRFIVEGARPCLWLDSREAEHHPLLRHDLTPNDRVCKLVIERFDQRTEMTTHTSRFTHRRETDLLKQALSRHLSGEGRSVEIFTHPGYIVEAAL